MTFDWTVNPIALVTWAVLIGGFIWKMSAFVQELRSFLQQFARHESEDDERFKALDGKIEGVHRRLDDLREMVRGKG